MEFGNGGGQTVRRIKIPDNLTSLAYKTIKNHIWEGDLEGEFRLTEGILAEKLGISKSPVREALNRLEAEGLIRIEPRRGAYLRSYTVKEIADLYDLRTALEVHAVATAKVTPELVSKLRESVERAKRHIESNDKLNYIEEDVNFHMLIATSTGNEFLKRALENVHRQVWLFRRKTYDLSRSRAVVVHEKMTQALAGGNKRTAQRLMREHISDVCARLVAHLEGERRPAKLRVANATPARREM
jgi:DNA-binding GntR family transcriptional regulator